MNVWSLQLPPHIHCGGTKDQLHGGEGAAFPPLPSDAHQSQQATSLTPNAAQPETPEAPPGSMPPYPGPESVTVQPQTRPHILSFCCCCCVVWKQPGTLTGRNCELSQVLVGECGEKGLGLEFGWSSAGLPYEEPSLTCQPHSSHLCNGHSSA